MMIRSLCYRNRIKNFAVTCHIEIKIHARYSHKIIAGNKGWKLFEFYSFL